MKFKFLCLFFLSMLIHNQALTEEVKGKIGTWEFVTNKGDSFISKTSKGEIGDWEIVTEVFEFNNKHFSWKETSKRKVGYWEIVIEAVEFSKRRGVSVIGGTSFNRGESYEIISESEGGTFGISIKHLIKCILYDLYLTTYDSDSELVSRLNKARTTLRAKVDQNEMILVKRVTKWSKKLAFTSTTLVDNYGYDIVAEFDSAANSQMEKLIGQMLVGKELLIDFNLDDGSNLNPVMKKIDQMKRLVGQMKKLIDQMLAGKELSIDFNLDDDSNLNPVVAKFNLDGFSEVYKGMCEK